MVGWRVGIGISGWWGAIRAVDIQSLRGYVVKEREAIR